MIGILWHSRGIWLACYDVLGIYDWHIMAFQRNMIGVLWRSRGIWLACYDIPEEYDWHVMTFQKNMIDLLWHSRGIRLTSYFRASKCSLPCPQSRSFFRNSRVKAVWQGGRFDPTEVPFFNLTFGYRSRVLLAVIHTEVRLWPRTLWCT
jgi:hypothetical protein